MYQEEEISESHRFQMEHEAEMELQAAYEAELASEQDKMHIDDGNIIEFLCGTHSYDGVWFGDKHPTRQGSFWWRSVLKEYFKEQIIQAVDNTEAEAVDFTNKMNNVLKLSQSDVFDIKVDAGRHYYNKNYNI